MKAICVAVVTIFLVALPRASGQFLLDGFLNDTIAVTFPDPPNSVITNNIDGTVIDRQISVQAAGALSIVSQVLDGVFVVDAGGAGSGSANAEVEYLGFLIDLGANTFFQFSTDRVAGTPLLGLILNDNTFGQLSGGLQLSPVTSETVFTLDITQFAGYTPGFGSALNGVTVFFGAGDETFFVEGNSFSFSSVPEPSSLLLVAAGALPAVFRRRRARSGL